MSARKLAVSALFICFAAALSALETWLPPIVPIPGVRVGLGNTVTLFILYIGGGWRGRDALIVTVLRCLLAALITGSVMNVFFGISGGLCAVAAMLLARRLLPQKERESWLPFAGAAGALAHILGQLVTAAVFYGTLAVFAYAPILAVSAVAGGVFTGLCAMLVLKKSAPGFLESVRRAGHGRDHHDGL